MQNFVNIYNVFGDIAIFPFSRWLLSAILDLKIFTFFAAN